MVQGGKPDHAAFWRDALGHIAQPEVRASPFHLPLAASRRVFPLRGPQLPWVRWSRLGPRESSAPNPSSVYHPVEATQGQILSQSPTNATFWR